MPRKSTSETDELLTNWEQVYKKGLLTFWILLLLHQRPSYAYEMCGPITELSQGTVSADENSIYRALNRFEAIGIVTSELRVSNRGPQRRYYSLTENGALLLTLFIRRNVLVFQSPLVAERIQAVLGTTNSPA